MPWRGPCHFLAGAMKKQSSYVQAQEPGAKTSMAAMGMPQPLGPGAAPAFCLSCRRRNVIPNSHPRAVSKKLDGCYGYAATPGPRGCSCLLPILPKVQCDSMAPPRSREQKSSMGAMGMPQPLGPGAAPAFCLSCRRRNVIAWRR